MKKIIINPNINVTYSAFYVKGLQIAFGKKNVSFADWNEINLFPSVEKILSFLFIVIDEEKSERIKVAIDYRDFNYITDKVSYEWSDIFGKVNTNWKITPIEEFPKIVCLPTNFSIRSFNFWESIFFSISNYPKVKPTKKKSYFSQYFKQKNKLWIEQFQIGRAHV